MINPAYHTVVHAIEGRKKQGSIERFVMTALHTVNGHTPYVTLREACVNRVKLKPPSQSIEDDVADWLATDLNPAVQSIRDVAAVPNVLLAYETYLKGDRVGATMSSFFHSWMDNNRLLFAAHVPEVNTTQKSETEPIELINPSSPIEDDHALFNLGQKFTEVVLDQLLSWVKIRSHADSGSLRLTDVAQHLDVESSASAEAAFCFEQDRYLTISQTAKLIGTSTRTLERQIKKDGISLELIRSAVRIAGVSRSLRGSESLTTIAQNEGYFDLSHMSRAFKASCGMSPSTVRAVIQYGLCGVKKDSMVDVKRL